MGEAKILLEQQGPNGNVKAVVEDDGRSVYFYLEGTEESGFGVRSCWVRNRKQAPAMMEVERMQAGLAPMLPAKYCVDPEAGRPLNEKSLELLWLEEGDAAALLENGDVLAVIPPWSGVNGFAGYARDCAMESILCEPLGSPDHDHHGIFARMSRAARFWASWDDNPWPGIQQGMMEALEKAMGPHTRYFSTPPERWPPRSMTIFAPGDALAICTGGMSLRPQPLADRHAEDPVSSRRVELGLAIDRTLAPDPMEPLVSYVNGQATLPWDRYAWLGEGHTIGCGVLPEVSSGLRFSRVLLWREPPGAPPIALPPFHGDPVSMLWMVPITEAESVFLGSYGARLLFERLAAAGAGWIHRDRDQADLTPPSR
ncbi:MAG TPA: suppressor of fused domain protein [Vulgatibacter sp.]